MGYIKFGGTINSRLLLGVESNAWFTHGSRVGVVISTTPVNELPILLINVSAAAYFYPSATGGFYLKGGLGVARFDPKYDQSEYGRGAVLGVGFNIPIGGKYSITPVLNYNTERFASRDTNILELGVGLTWH